MDDHILLTPEDARTGLAIWREYQRQHDLLHVAENDWQRWCAQMEVLYQVPTGWRMKNILRGFEPPQEAA